MDLSVGLLLQVNDMFQNNWVLGKSIAVMISD